MPLGQKFFNQPTVELAQALLGCSLVYGDLRGIIVETEAYLYHSDPGCHAARAKPEICRGKRISLSAGQELELRFFIKGNRFVSRAAK